MKLVSPFIKKLYTISALVLLIALNGCGGDSSSSSSSFTPADSGTPSLELSISADATEIPSDGKTAIALTSILRDQEGNPVAGSPVNLVSSSGQITMIDDGNTNAQGAVSAQLTISSPALVDVIVTASVDAVSESLSLPVVGTTLVMNVQNSSALGKSVPIELTLLDSSNQPIEGETITLSSMLGNPFDTNAPVTNNEGKATAFLTTNIEGKETLSASALSNTVSSPQNQITIDSNVFSLMQSDINGNPVFQAVPFSETSYIKLTWSSDSEPVANQTVSLSTTKGTFVSSGDLFAELDTEDNGEIIIAIEDQDQPGLATVTATGIKPGDDGSDALSTNIEITFVSDDPQQITLAALPPSINVTETTTVSAQVTDALGNPVPYTVVALSITDQGGGSISPGEIITDLNGLAEATFTPNRSAQIVEAVEIIGTVRSNASVTNNVLITVSEESLGVTIGTGNTSFVTKQETSYLIQYIARVTDINGLGIPDANVDVSIAPYSFRKGFFQPVDTNNNGQETGPGDYISGSFDRWRIVITTDPDCANEDVNANGLLDLGEDTNGDSVLSPGQVASLDPQVNGEISLTDEFGETYIDIRYPQDHADWVRYEITATITTDQNTVVKDIALPWLPTDINELDEGDTPPANQNSPWGRSDDCTNID